MLVASVHHQPSSVLLNFETLSSNSFDKSVGDKPQNVCWKVSVVFTSRITFSFNLVPLYTTVSKNIVSVNFGGEFNSRIVLYVRGLKEYVCMLRVTSHDIPPGKSPSEPSCSIGE